MRVAIGTVIYQQAWKWRDFFINSITSQTYKTFELLVINDNLKNSELAYFNNHCNGIQVDIINGDDGATISENRIRMLKEAKKRKYDLLILADFDDGFMNNRVSKTIEAYDKSICIYFNNLCIEGTQKIIFSNLDESIAGIDELLEKNFLGLSNTAVNLNLIREEFIDSLENIETNVFDWYFFSRLLMEGNTGILVPNTLTLYRIQENNLAGVMRDDLVSLKREINIKLYHYSILKKYDIIYNELFKEYLQLSEVEEELLYKYMSKQDDGMWWNHFNLRRT